VPVAVPAAVPAAVAVPSEPAPADPATGPPAAPAVPAAAATTTPGAVGGATAPAAGIPDVANRFVVTLADAPLGTSAAVDGQHVAVTGSGPLVTALGDELARRGAAGGGAGGGTVVVTDLLEPGGTVDMPELYARIRPILLDSASDVVVVTPLGGGLGIDPPAPRPAGGDLDVVPHGAGARGLVKTAALEFPDRRIRLVDVDPATPVAELAATLADEVQQADAPVEVAWRDGRRRASRITPRPAAPRRVDRPLSGASTVLLTGGARGITARIALAMATATGCHVELVGRSAQPQGDEDPALAAAADRPALRTALIGAGWREPKAIEKECDRLLAEREVAASLAALSAVAATVTYHQVDVRDAGALAATVDGIYARRGRLDGIVHGAGVVDDHFIADKDPDAFARVFATKTDAARTLLGTVRRHVAGGRPRPAFVALFGSIAGVCGNRGQVDYAAANDALDTIAASNADVADRVFAVDWGPWSSEAGMVSDALAKLFEGSGMGLIALDDGAAVLLDEIATTGNGAGPEPHQVTVARCAPELMAAALGSTVGGGG
ncbi:MAG TPA: SDR family NAD(P)-dependent oxidoreductase, partial [Acidimicrobiales bacterium]|nr:SDR family NAD(P)-dependent oxidoreductase [Acidimicrobiales bacterium]